MHEIFAIARVFFLEKFAKDSAIFIYTYLGGFFSRNKRKYLCETIPERASHSSKDWREVDQDTDGQLENIE